MLAALIIQILPALELVPEGEIQDRVRSDAPIVGHEALVQAVQALGAQGFAETVPHAAVHQTPSVGVDAWKEKRGMVIKV